MTGRIIRGDVITQQRLKELVTYDPLTGVFTNLVHRRQARAGNPVGSPTGDGHLRMQLFGRTYACHRMAWLYTYGAPVPEIIDHANGIGSDNRIANLRAATALENTGNRKTLCTNGLGFKGVRQRGGKFQALITVNNRQVPIGLFDTPEEASAAYLHAARERFGEFARAQ